jgi:hypothetical protein
VRRTAIRAIRCPIDRFARRTCGRRFTEVATSRGCVLGNYVIALVNRCGSTKQQTSGREALGIDSYRDLWVGPQRWNAGRWMPYMRAATNVSMTSSSPVQWNHVDMIRGVPSGQMNATRAGMVEPRSRRAISVCSSFKSPWGTGMATLSLAMIMQAAGCIRQRRQSPHAAPRKSTERCSSFLLSERRSANGSAARQHGTPARSSCPLRAARISSSVVSARWPCTGARRRSRSPRRGGSHDPAP